MSEPFSRPRRSFLEALRRPVARLDAGELIGIMARREMLRQLPSGGRFLGLIGGMLGLAVITLLIPLHRFYGGEPLQPATYFLDFALVLQVAVAILCGRAPCAIHPGRLLQ